MAPEREWTPCPRTDRSGDDVQGASSSTLPSTGRHANSGSRGKLFSFPFNSQSAYIRTFYSFSAESENQECLICRGPVGDEDRTLSGCKDQDGKDSCHAQFYHESCLQMWRAMKNICPTCKKPLPALPIARPIPRLTPEPRKLFLFLFEMSDLQF